MYTQYDLDNLLSSYNLPSLSQGVPGQRAIRDAMRDMFGFSQGVLTKDLFTDISQSQLYGTKGKDYSPGIQSNISQFTGDLMKQLDVGGVAGGFADSSQYRGYETGVRDEYGRNALDVLSQFQAAKSNKLSSLMDHIQGWKETASSFV